MARALQLFLALFGAVCVGIGLAHIAFGPSAIPGSIPVNATMDSEDRFYATLFLGFGAAHVWCAQALPSRKNILLAMQAVFFLGGVSRLVSWTQVGPPIPFFATLTALELLIPLLVWWWLNRAYPRAASM